VELPAVRAAPPLKKEDSIDDARRLIGLPCLESLERRLDEAGQLEQGPPVRLLNVPLPIWASSQACLNWYLATCYVSIHPT
jgi:hypothetical protein